LMDSTSFHDEIRMLDNETLIGKWFSPELNTGLLRCLGAWLEPTAAGDRFAFRYILRRTQAGRTAGV